MQMCLIKSLFKLIILLSILASCKASKRDHALQTKIIFVNLRIAKDDSGREHVELIDKVWVTGELKKRETHEKATHPLTCEFLDAKDNLLATITIQNPLNESFEDFSSEGSIARKQVTLNEASFTLRTEVSEGATYLKVSNTVGTIGIISLQ